MNTFTTTCFFCKTIYYMSVFVFMVSTVCNAQNMITNGSFEENLSSWKPVISNGGTAKINAESIYATSGKKSIKVEVQALGSDPWNIQLFQPFNSRKGQHYTLSFWAKTAILKRKLRVQLENVTYSPHEVEVDFRWKQYTINFTAKEEDLKLSFQFLEHDTYYIDDIVLTKGRKSEKALIENGDFENGLSGWFSSTSNNSRAHFEVEKDNTNPSNHCLNVFVSKLGQNVWDIVTVHNLEGAKKKTYIISFYAKTEGNNKSVILQLQNNEKQIYIPKKIMLSDQWEYYEEQFTLPSDKMELALLHETKGVFSFDKFKMYPKNSVAQSSGYRRK